MAGLSDARDNTSAPGIGHADVDTSQRGEGGNTSTAQQQPKPKLIPLADGRFLTPEGEVITRAAAEARGFQIPSVRVDPDSPEGRRAAEINRRARSNRLGSSQTILTSPGGALGLSNVRRSGLQTR